MMPRAPHLIVASYQLVVITIEVKKPVFALLVNYFRCSTRFWLAALKGTGFVDRKYQEMIPITPDVWDAD
jgi:hypothetical protein